MPDPYFGKAKWCVFWAQAIEQRQERKEVSSVTQQVYLPLLWPPTTYTPSFRHTWSLGHTGTRMCTQTRTNTHGLPWASLPPQLKHTVALTPAVRNESSLTLCPAIISLCYSFPVLILGFLSTLKELTVRSSASRASEFPAHIQTQIQINAETQGSFNKTGVKVQNVV